MVAGKRLLVSEQYITQVGTGAGVPGLSWLAASANLIPNAGLPGGSSLLVTRRVDCWLAVYLLSSGGESSSSSVSLSW